MKDIWTYGYLDVEKFPWLPFVCLLGCLAAFWWLRYKIPKVPHSISATAYDRRSLFTEYCLMSSNFLSVLVLWEFINYTDDIELFGAFVSAQLLPWLARFWDFMGRHRVQHYILALLIFIPLIYWSGGLWWLVALMGVISFIGSRKKYKIFWTEAVILHLIIAYRLYLYYIWQG